MLAKLITVFIFRPTGRLLCEMYQEREPAKISMMNSVSASQILTFSNIKHSSNVIVIDTSAGLMLALAMQRLGAEGKILLFFLNIFTN